MKVLRKLTVWALFLGFFIHTIGVSVYHGLYIFNQPVFVELFCVNKDQPELKCNGSCKLADLEKQQNQDTEKPSLPEITQFQMYFFVQLFDFITPQQILISFKHNLYNHDFYSTPFLGEVFRPPILV